MKQATEKLITFGTLLKIKREALNETSNTVGKAIGISGASILNYEKSRNKPNSYLVNKLIKFYKITADELKICVDYIPHENAVNSFRKINKLLPGVQNFSQKEFADLLKTKRLKMGLSLDKARKMMGFGSSLLNRYEDGKWLPGKEKLDQLIKFYNITDEELTASGIDIKSEPLEIPKIEIKQGILLTIPQIIDHLSGLAAKVKSIKQEGKLAETIKSQALENLTKASGLLYDVQIVERFL
jgi:transcriptional regulator with XRE-family HTH domain